MIQTLAISNYALIDSITLKFGRGLNIITGETGAGKSIMLGALSMLLGNRADTRVVRDKEKKSIVEAVFDISLYPELKSIAEGADIDWDDKSLILRREITPSGRSRSFINDSPVTLTTLRDAAVQLVDLHSQHQNLLLATPEYQLKIIDTLITDKTVKTLYAEAYDEFRQSLKRYQQAKRALEAGRADEEYLRFQLEKLSELDLVEGEQADLEQQREVLANASSLKQSLRRVISLFTDDEDTSMTARLAEAANIAMSLESLPDAQALARRVESLQIEAADIADTLEQIDNHLEADPRRLEEIEDRLAAIYDLERKHQVDSVEQLIDLRDQIATKLSAVDNGDQRVKALAARAKKAKLRALEIAAQLTAERRAVADRFAKELYDGAAPLGMKNLTVKIDLDPADLGPTGADNVAFLFSFNKNQPLMPVKDTASGGEISRLMLVVKSIIADKMQLPTIIFDEIDTGVSGDVANRMGDLMKSVAERIQVIAITHLPSVAAKGANHYKVYKEDDDLATNTRVRFLSESDRVDELAMMLSGDPQNQSARQTAISLLERSSSNH